MSRYLIDRIERSPRIEVMTETEVTAVRGTATVETVDLRDRRTGTVAPVPATAVFVMIGATPCNEAAQGTVAVDAAGYLLCGSGAAGCDGHLSWPLKDREPHLLETVRPGCSPPATCVPERQTAWRARSVTGRSPSGSPTTSWPADGLSRKVARASDVPTGHWG